MENKKLFLEFSKFVSLNVVGMIGLSCYILADTFFVSKGIGTTGLAALNIALPIFNLVNATALFIAIGAASKYSILKAKGEEKKANEVFGISALFALAISLLYIIVGVFFSEELTNLLGADKDVFEMTNIYIKVILIFSVFFIFNNLLIAFIRNDNNPKLSMMAMLLGSVSNIILDYIFIFHLGMGMFGAVLATGIAPIVSIAILSVHFITKKANFKFSLPENFKMSKLFDILQAGISSFINEMASGIILLTFNIVILGLSGNIAVAAYGVVANLALIVIAIYTGVAQGIQPLLSKNFGTENYNNVKLIFKYSITLAIIISTVVYMLTFVFSDNLVAIFNSEKNIELSIIAREGLRIYFIGFMFAGINIVVSAFLSAIEETKKAFMVSLLRGGLLIIPFVFVLSSMFGMRGIYLSFPVSEGVCLLSAFILLKQKSKINIFVPIQKKMIQ